MDLKKEINSLDKSLLRVIKRITKFAETKDQRVYLVGGFVRDMLLNIKNLDMDIIVQSQGIKFAYSLSKEFNAQITAHARFGTAVISGNDFKIDIATFRKEKYPYPGSLPIVSAGSLADDLARRDFTINAMAVSINKNDFGRIIDYFGGLDDLNKKQLKVLHRQSFLDDPTRILRLARFKSRFGFFVPAATARLIGEAREEKALEKMQKHRVRDELVLIFKEREPEAAIECLKDLYGLQFFHQNLRFDNFEHKTFVQIRRAFYWFENKFPLYRPAQLWLMYLIVFLSRLDTKAIERIVADFAFKRGELIRVSSFKKNSKRLLHKLNNPWLSPSEVYNILNPLSYEVILSLYALSKCPRVKKYIRDFLEIYNLTRIKISGHDLKKLGVAPGPSFKKILQKVREGKLNLKLTTKHQELSLAKRLIKR